MIDYHTYLFTYLRGINTAISLNSPWVVLICSLNVFVERNSTIGSHWAAINPWGWIRMIDNHTYLFTYLGGIHTTISLDSPWVVFNIRSSLCKGCPSRTICCHGAALLPWSRIRVACYHTYLASGLRSIKMGISICSPSIVLILKLNKTIHRWCSTISLHWAWFNPWGWIRIS
jgi:hypothetical protein